MRRGRITLLALLALALPMAARATTIFFNTETFVPGPTNLITAVNASGGLSATNALNINVVGTKDRFRLLHLTLSTGCQMAGPSLTGCTITGGPTSTLDVFGAGGLLFSTSLAGLTADVFKGTGTAVFMMALGNISALHCLGCELVMGLSWNLGPPPSGLLVAGNARIQGTSVIPEPGTLGLFATGLMSLAGLARRKLKQPI